MRYIFELCPECMDHLAERDIEDFQEYHESCCPNCGSKMQGVLFGITRAEDSIYKITINKVRDMSKYKEKCLEVLVRISGLDAETLLEKMKTGDSVIFEGDLLHTYLALTQLDQIEYMISYVVTPDFPYARAFSIMCPDCGEEAKYKVIYGEGDTATGGFFCERCKEWVMYTGFCKADVDETEYYIETSLEKVKDNVKEQILHYIDDLWEKK